MWPTQWNHKFYNVKLLCNIIYEKVTVTSVIFNEASEFLDDKTVKQKIKQLKTYDEQMKKNSKNSKQWKDDKTVKKRQ